MDKIKERYNKIKIQRKQLKRKLSKLLAVDVYSQMKKYKQDKVKFELWLDNIRECEFWLRKTKHEMNGLREEMKYNHLDVKNDFKSFIFSCHLTNDDILRIEDVMYNIFRNTGKNSFTFNDIKKIILNNT